MHRAGVNISTNAMWSTRVREFLTHTGRSHCQEAPVLALHAHAYTCPHRLAPQTRGEGRHVHTWEHVCVSRDTQAHMQMTHRFVCAQLCLGAHPSTPCCTPTAAQRALGLGTSLPFGWCPPSCPVLVASSWI